MKTPANPQSADWDDIDRLDLVPVERDGESLQPHPILTDHDQSADAKLRGQEAKHLLPVRGMAPLIDALGYCHEKLDERMERDDGESRSVTYSQWERDAKQYVQDNGWPSIAEYYASKGSWKDDLASSDAHEEAFPSPPTDTGFPPITPREYFGDYSVVLTEAAGGEYTNDGALTTSRVRAPPTGANPILDRDEEIDTEGEAETILPPSYNIAGRGWSDATIDNKWLGWAPNNKDELAHYLFRRGYTREQILATGIFTVSDWASDKPKAALLPTYDTADPEAIPTTAEESDYPTVETAEWNTDIAQGLTKKLDLWSIFQGAYVFPYFSPITDAAVGRPDPDAIWDQEDNPVASTEACAPAYAIAREPNGDGINSSLSGKYAKCTKRDTSWVDEPLYGVETIRYGEPLLITEGMPDAISAHDEGIPAISPVTTGFKDDHVELLSAILEKYTIPHVYLALDNDPVGYESDEMNARRWRPFERTHSDPDRNPKDVATTQKVLDLTLPDQELSAAIDTDDLRERYIERAHSIDEQAEPATSNDLLWYASRQGFPVDDYDDAEKLAENLTAYYEASSPLPVNLEFEGRDRPPGALADTELSDPAEYFYQDRTITRKRPTWGEFEAGPISYFLNIRQYGPGEEGAMKIADQLEDVLSGTRPIRMLHLPRFGPGGSDFDDYVQDGFFELLPPFDWQIWAAREFAIVGRDTDIIAAGRATWYTELAALERFSPDGPLSAVTEYASTQPAETDLPIRVIAANPSGDPDEVKPALTEYDVDPPGDLDSTTRHSAPSDGGPYPAVDAMFGTVPSAVPKYHPGYARSSTQGYNAKASSELAEADSDGEVREELQGGLGADDRNSVFMIRMRDVLPSSMQKDRWRGENPLGHRGDSDNYFVVYENGGVYRVWDFKRKTGYGPLEFLLVQLGERSVDNPKRPTITPEEQFKLWVHTRERGIVSEDAQVPSKGVTYFAIEHGLATEEDLIEVDDGTGGTFPGFPPEIYNETLQVIEAKTGLQSNRAPIDEDGDEDPMMDFVHSELEGADEETLMNAFAETYLETISQQEEYPDSDDFWIESRRLRALYDVWSAYHGDDSDINPGAFMHEQKFKSALDVEPDKGRKRLGEDNQPVAIHHNISLSSRGEELDDIVEKTDNLIA
jgi:hypothetical protein